MTRDRFPVTPAAIRLVVDASPNSPRTSDEIARDLRAAAPETVKSWIDALTDTELLTLRFNPGRDWCQQVRERLTRLTEETS